MTTLTPTYQPSLKTRYIMEAMKCGYNLIWNVESCEFVLTQSNSNNKGTN